MEKKLPLDSNLICAIPVSMRGPNDWSLTNKSCTVDNWFPMNIQDPLKRLKEIQKRMTFLKTSYEPAVNFFLMKLIGPYIPISFSRHFMDKYHAVMTNVPGPAVPLTFASKDINSYVAIIPQSGAGGLGVAILSYTNKVTVSILGDIPHDDDDTSNITPKDSIVCPTLITRHFQLEFDNLLSLASSDHS